MFLLSNQTLGVSSPAVAHTLRLSADTFQSQLAVTRLAGLLDMVLSSFPDQAYPCMVRCNCQVAVSMESAVFIPNSAILATCTVALKT